MAEVIYDSPLDSGVAPYVHALAADGIETFGVAVVPPPLGTRSRGHRCCGNCQSAGTVTASGRFVRIMVVNDGGGEAKDVHATLDFRAPNDKQLIPQPFQ